VGNENSDAQNNKGCNYSFKHRRILRNRFTKRSTSCIVKEILLSVMNFPPHDDFEQHPTHAPPAAPPARLRGLGWQVPGRLSNASRGPVCASLDAISKADARHRMR
jgi:hypothetical protein